MFFIQNHIKANVKQAKKTTDQAIRWGVRLGVTH